MTGHHLVAQTNQDVHHRELASLLRDLGVEDDLEQEVSELLLHRAQVAALDGLEHFVGLLDDVRLERRPCLLSVPRATIGTTEARHDVQEPFEECTRGLGHVRTRSQRIIQHGPAHGRLVTVRRPGSTTTVSMVPDTVQRVARGIGPSGRMVSRTAGMRRLPTQRDSTSTRSRRGPARAVVASSRSGPRRRSQTGCPAHRCGRAPASEPTESPRTARSGSRPMTSTTPFPTRWTAPSARGSSADTWRARKALISRSKSVTVTH